MKAMVISFVTSVTIKYLALLAVILPTAAAAKQFNFNKSTHILILSKPFLGVTTVNAYHCLT